MGLGGEAVEFLVAQVLVQGFGEEFMAQDDGAAFVEVGDGFAEAFVFTAEAQGVAGILGAGDGGVADVGQGGEFGGGELGPLGGKDRGGGDFS